MRTKQTDLAETARVATTSEIVPTTRLHELEAIIERGKQTFIEVGEALLEIRAKRLYKATHDSFEDYLAERWGMTRQRSTQLIGAAEVAKRMATRVAIPDEKTAREIRSVFREEGPDAAAEVLEQAKRATGKVSAAGVRKVKAARPRKPEPIRTKTKRGTQPGNGLRGKSVAARYVRDAMAALSLLMPEDLSDDGREEVLPLIDFIETKFLPAWSAPVIPIEIATTGLVDVEVPVEWVVA
jgi:hypothetical protein